MRLRGRCGPYGGFAVPQAGGSWVGGPVGPSGKSTDMVLRTRTSIYGKYDVAIHNNLVVNDMSRIKLPDDYMMMGYKDGEMYGAGEAVLTGLLLMSLACGMCCRSRRNRGTPAAG